MSRSSAARSYSKALAATRISFSSLVKKLGKKETLALITKLEKDMRAAAKALEYERAAELRDMIFELRERSR